MDTQKQLNLPLQPKGRDEDVKPHVFATAAASFKGLDNKKAQTILISGLGPPRRLSLRFCSFQPHRTDIPRSATSNCVLGRDFSSFVTVDI